MGMEAPPQQKTLRDLRLQTFRRRYELDRGLLEAIKDAPGHDFIRNPAGQLSYLYLTAYVAEAAAYWCQSPPTELKVLDWGAGRGQTSFLLERFGFKMTMADLLSGPDAPSFTDAPLLVGRDVISLTHPWKLPFEDGAFDVSLSFGVLEHVEDDVRSLSELHRVTQPGGLLFVFYLPQVLSWTQRVAHLRGNRYHDRLYGMRRTRDMLRESGFQVLDEWHRQLLPKNAVRWPLFRQFERLDQLASSHPPLMYFTTDIEFVATPL